MALLFFSGFETGYFSTEMLSPSALPNRPVIQNTIKKTGTYAVRCNTADEPCAFSAAMLPYKRLTFWLYVASFPLPEDDWVPIVNRSGSQIRCGVEINSDGQIRSHSYGQSHDYWNSNFYLSTGQWYRVCILSAQWNAETLRGKTRCYVNGILVSSDDDSRAQGPGWFIGIGTPKPVGEPIYATCDIYFDNIIYDDVDSLEDMGDIRVLNANVIGAGEYAEFSDYVGSADHFENVDSIPCDADYNYNLSDSPAKESYNLENCSTIGLADNDILKAVRTLCRMKYAGSGKGPKYNILRRDNEVDCETLVTLSSSFVVKDVIDNLMPNGEDNWTQDRFDALEVGMYCNGDGTRDPYLSWVVVMVAFSPFVEGEKKSAPALNFGSSGSGVSSWDF